MQVTNSQLVVLVWAAAVLIGSIAPAVLHSHPTFTAITRIHYLSNLGPISDPHSIFFCNSCDKTLNFWKIDLAIGDFKLISMGSKCYRQSNTSNVEKKLEIEIRNNLLENWSCWRALQDWYQYLYFCFILFLPIAVFNIGNA